MLGGHDRKSQPADGRRRHIPGWHSPGVRGCTARGRRAWCSSTGGRATEATGVARWAHWWRGTRRWPSISPVMGSRRRAWTMAAFPAGRVGQGGRVRAAPGAAAGRVGRGRPHRLGKVHGDKAYDHRRCRAYLRHRGIRPGIARRMIESSTRLGRHRWTIERTGPGWAASGGCASAMSETPDVSMLWRCWPVR
jgi:hypothetical protein